MDTDDRGIEPGVAQMSSGDLVPRSPRGRRDLAERGRGSRRSASARSFSRPVARLLASKSARPITGTLVPSKSAITRRGQAFANVVPQLP